MIPMTSPASVNRRASLLRRGLSRCAGAWLGEPFGLSPFGLTGPFRTGGRLLAGVVTVTGCSVISPNSTGVDRHQLEVAIQLQPRVQVVDPVGQQGVLGGRHAGLGAQQLVGQGGGRGGRTLLRAGGGWGS